MSRRSTFDAQMNRLQAQRAVLDTMTANIRDMHVGMDSVQSYAGAIRIPITDMGRGARFGENITDENRQFGSRREPVGVRVVKDVALDIFDNWFKVVDKANTSGDELDDVVQDVLTKLNAKKVFTLATIYERRYGTSIIVCAYDDDTENLDDPLKVEDDEAETSTPIPGTSGQTIRMIEPYWKGAFKIDDANVTDLKDLKSRDGDQPDTRLGLPKKYGIKVSGSTAATYTDVDWTRVVHLATRLDESKYWGLSILDYIYDDLTVFRNVRWAMGQTMYRYGSGFADITVEGINPAIIDTWEAEGRFNDIMARTHFVHSDRETLEFKGAQGAVLNPSLYYEPILENLSIGSRIPKALLRGAQAGTVTGSETNILEYGRFISAEQSNIEPMVREVIDRLMKIGQIKFTGEYEIVWNAPFEVSDREKAEVDSIREDSNVKKLQYMTPNEVRRLNEIEPDLEDGNTLKGTFEQNFFNQGEGNEGDLILMKRMRAKKPESPATTSAT